mmetsp:Transcript_5990/g.10007  ORF Transcript_5990/g.10007 Transcript_5990/m.10007 type:complete len:532 (-) Transcript_5990:161-1756(-)
MGRSTSSQNNRAAANGQQRTTATSIEQRATLEDTITRLEADSWSFSSPPSLIPADTTGEGANWGEQIVLEQCNEAGVLRYLDDGNNQTSPPLVRSNPNTAPIATIQNNQRQQEEQLEQATVAVLVQGIESQCHAEIMIAAGLSYFSDAINIVATFFIALNFEEHGWQSAIVASSIFMGSLVGNLISFCYLSERFGNRRVFVVTSILRPLLGVLTLAAFNFPSMVVLRFLVGVMSCGRSQAFQVLDEFSSKSRSKTVWIYMQLFWSAGVILVSVIESILAPDWRGMVIWAQVFVAIASAIGICWLPESPSWLLRRGECNLALLTIGNRCGPDFDWLVAIQPNPPSHHQNPSIIMERRRLWGIWCCFGMLYFGSMYLVNTIFHGSNGYYGTIVATAELEVFGILLGWFGTLRIGSRWVQILGFLVGGISVTLVAAWEEDHATAVTFAIIGRFSLMAAITASFVYAMEVRVTTPLTMFAMAHLGALGAPFYIDFSWAITVSVLATETILIVYFSWYLPEKKTSDEQREVTTSFL